jgi:diguanylate cyclase (GGDEF)-like protein
MRPPDYRLYRLRRACADLYERSLVGPPFYIVGSLLAAWINGEIDEVMWATLLCAGVFGALLAARKRNRVPPGGDLHALEAWERRQWTLVYLGYAVWSAMSAFIALHERGPTPTLDVVILATSAYLAAGAATFTADLRRLRFALLIVVAPCVVIWLPMLPELRLHAFILAVYSVYCLALGKRLHHEYESQLSLEFDLMQSRAEVDALARTDVLTGIWNRREYENEFHARWTQRSRNPAALSLIIIDLDLFKRINDQYGHQTGDACLRHAAQSLRHHFRRANDLVARIGGEEFAVILPDTTLAEAQRLAELWRGQIEASPCVVGDHRIGMTASIGVGEVDMTRDATPDASFARVDAACYVAKESGRNRVIVAN